MLILSHKWKSAYCGNCSIHFEKKKFAVEVLFAYKIWCIDTPKYATFAIFKRLLSPYPYSFKFPHFGNSIRAPGTHSGYPTGLSFRCGASTLLLCRLGNYDNVGSGYAPRQPVRYSSSPCFPSDSPILPSLSRSRRWLDSR